MDAAQLTNPALLITLVGDSSAVSPDRSRAQLTKEALLQSATQVFAELGYHGASLRDLAQHAKVNQALISYHFGSKEGLYLAVFAAIGQQMQDRLGGILSAELPDNRAKALMQLLLLANRMVWLMSDDQSQAWSQLIMREQQEPTAAFDVMYEGVMTHLLTRLEALVELARSPDDPSDSKLQVAFVLGQALVFRASRAGVMRFNGWDQMDATIIAGIQRQLRRNLTLMMGHIPDAR